MNCTHTKLWMLIIVPVLFVGLSISEVKGDTLAARRQQKGFRWADSRLGLEFGFGIPYNKLIKLSEKSDNIGYTTVMKTESPCNYSIGLLAGYSFPVSKHSKWGFETGLGLTFGKKTKIMFTVSEVNKITNVNISLAEKYLKIPLLLTNLKLLPASFYCAYTFIIGYEFDIILKSDLDVEVDQPNYSAIFPTYLKKIIDSQKSLSDIPSLSGSIVVMSRFDFPKGIYAGIASRIPIEIFSILKYKKEIQEKDTCVRSFVGFSRLLSANLLELTIGVNIVDWIYPPS